MWYNNDGILHQPKFIMVSQPFFSAITQFFPSTAWIFEFSRSPMQKKKKKTIWAIHNIVINTIAIFSKKNQPKIIKVSQSSWKSGKTIESQARYTLYSPHFICSLPIYFFLCISHQPSHENSNSYMKFFKWKIEQKVNSFPFIFHRNIVHG